MRYLTTVFCVVMLSSLPFTVHAQNAMQMEDNAVFTKFMLDQFENRFSGDANTLAWEAQFLAGGDFNKLWIKTEGDWSDGETGSADLQLLYDHAITTFWDLQTGVRQDFGFAPAREWLAFGVQGLAPYFFDLEATGFIGPAGRTAVRFRGSYELLFTQRLILEPELEANLYGRDDPARRTGSGLSNLELGLRLRYEIRRQFAPYVGIVYVRSYGHTADYARLTGKSPDETRVMAGLRVWF